MNHYYLCDFHIYRDGNLKTRPRVKPRYIEAGNTQKAYEKAQLICHGPLISKYPDRAVCRHKDIHLVLIDEARREIAANPILLVEVEEDKPASTEKDSGIYALITWPCSQEYIGHPDCFFYTSEANGENNPNLDQAVFVPETLLPGDERGEYAIVDWPESQTREDGIYGASWNEEEDEQEYLFAPVK